jgi:hypothetical protein
MLPARDEAIERRSLNGERGGGSPPTATAGHGVRSRPRSAALRVAVLAPIAWRVPPRHYGPWEQFEARRRRRAPAPDLLRGVVWLQRRRGHGLLERR